MQRVVGTLEETIALGERAGRATSADDCIVLCGDLGAGKTQFTKGVARGLGVAEEITSPTFNVVIEYHSGRLPLYHFDLYRLDDEWELDDIGYYDLLEAGGLSVIEWGDRFEDALPDDYLRISIKLGAGTERLLHIEPHGARSQVLCDAMLRES